jgi:hypothetical protein
MTTSPQYEFHSEHLQYTGRTVLLRSLDQGLAAVNALLQLPHLTLTALRHQIDGIDASEQAGIAIFSGHHPRTLLQDESIWYYLFGGKHPTLTHNRQYNFLPRIGAHADLVAAQGQIIALSQVTMDHIQTVHTALDPLLHQMIEPHQRLRERQGYMPH